MKRLAASLLGVGAALRQAYADRTPRPPRRVTNAPPPAVKPSNCVEEAADRVSKSTDALLLLSALTLNPFDAKALDAGIETALRRLSDDVVEEEGTGAA